MGTLKSGPKAAIIARLVSSLETSFRMSMDRFESQESRRKALDDLKGWFQAIDDRKSGGGKLGTATAGSWIPAGTTTQQQEQRQQVQQGASYPYARQQVSWECNVTPLPTDATPSLL